MSPKSPEGYFAIGEFTENDVTYNAWQPSNDKVEQVLIVEARKDGELLKTAKVQMLHPNIWGIDVEDGRRLDEAVDKLIEEFKDNG